VADRRHITDLRIAFEGERRATKQARAARHHTDALIARARAAGVPYTKIAHIILKMRLGRAPSAKERQNEADTLRQRRRRAVTGRHEDVIHAGLKTARTAVSSSVEVKPMSERLIRRKIVEEEFLTDEKHGDLNCEDGKDAAPAETDADDDEEKEDEEDEEEE
jgi:hypothetical protein